jgi:pyridoxamine 5'-phosphate oxidase
MGSSAADSTELADREPFDDPFEWFDRWYERAKATELEYPNALTLATVSPSGQPRARTILLKEWDREGFVFYTNYRSAKGEDLGARPAASLQVYWHPFERQFRIEGGVERLDPEESDAYFATRSRRSQIGAWASSQSDPLESRDALLERFREYEGKFDGGEVPRPNHWGGYRVVPDRFIFWRAGEHRLHERWAFVEEEGGWHRTRLNP